MRSPYQPDHIAVIAPPPAPPLTTAAPGCAAFVSGAIAFTRVVDVLLAAGKPEGVSGARAPRTEHQTLVLCLFVLLPTLSI